MPITVTAGGHGLGERMGVGEKVGWSKGVSITYLKRMDASEFNNMKRQDKLLQCVILTDGDGSNQKCNCNHIGVWVYVVLCSCCVCVCTSSVRLLKGRVGLVSRKANSSGCRQLWQGRRGIRKSDVVCGALLWSV